MISVIIPVLNEEQEIARCLESVIRQNCLEKPEIILVDGGSRDETLRIAEAILGDNPSARVLSSPRGRGRQMNRGAAEAGGEMLLFLHGDTHLAPGAIRRLELEAAGADVDAGCFRHHFDGNGPTLRLISMLHDLRFSCSGVIYGDQGLFVRRRLFLELGGFAEDRVMEDIEFSERLLRRTRPIRLPLPITTSSRKFEQIGPVRAFVHVLRLIAGYELGITNPHRHRFFLDYR